MGEPVLVRAEGTEFYVQLAEAAGPQPVGLDQVMSFEGVRETVTAICRELAKAWDVVKPAEASVELALKVVARAGKLTGMLVDGGGEAALKVTLTWKGE
ncbi:MAG: CU044_2847 family protein [Streptosporangiaceae bacterium]